eukprot:scaffold88941_cov48-Phaeocystis_antarctica.AAC.4
MYSADTLLRKYTEPRRPEPRRAGQRSAALGRPAAGQPPSLTGGGRGGQRCRRSGGWRALGQPRRRPASQFDRRRCLRDHEVGTRGERDEVVLEGRDRRVAQPLRRGRGEVRVCGEVRVQEGGCAAHADLRLHLRLELRPLLRLGRLEAAQVAQRLAHGSATAERGSEDCGRSGQQLRAKERDRVPTRRLARVGKLDSVEGRRDTAQV